MQLHLHFSAKHVKKAWWLRGEMYAKRWCITSTKVNKGAFLMWLGICNEGKHAQVMTGLNMTQT